MTRAKRMAWITPRLFILYPGLIKEPPLVASRDGLTYVRWTNTEDGPPEVVVILAAQGPITWDYTIRDPELGFMRHHFGPWGDPDRDAWTDLDL